MASSVKNEHERSGSDEKDVGTTVARPDTLVDVVEDTETFDDVDDARSDAPSERLIEDSQLFKALGHDERQQLVDSGRRVTFEPGEVILEEGDEGTFFFLIEDGEVDVTTSVAGKTVVLATLSRGAIFGEVSAFSNKPRTATVTAASLVEAIRFENEALRRLLDQSPNAREELQSLVLGRARDTIEKLTGGS